MGRGKLGLDGPSAAAQSFLWSTWPEAVMCPLSVFGRSVLHAGLAPTDGAPKPGLALAARTVIASLVLLACGSVMAQSCVRPASGLLSWWRAEDSAKDTLGAHPGLASGGTAYVAGMVGRAFAFDGVKDVVLIADAAPLGFTSTASFTIELWAYRTSGASVQHLFGKRQGCGSPPFYQVAVGTGAIPFSVVPLNTWTHVAVTYNGATGVQDTYANASLVSSVNAFNFIGVNNAPLTIGNSGTCAGFGGHLDEVSLYKRALSAEELRAIVSAGSAGKCDPTPTCAMRLNRSTYLDGDPIVALQAALTNPGSSARAIEVKLWFERPDGVTTVPFLSAGADASFVLPAGFSGDYAPLDLAAVQPTTQRGTHKFRCRVLDAVTGETLSEETQAYQVQ